jgi:hypothetical protein
MWKMPFTMSTNAIFWYAHGSIFCSYLESNTAHHIKRFIKVISRCRFRAASGLGLRLLAILCTVIISSVYLIDLSFGPATW